MAYYLKWLGDSGAFATNTESLKISGITGAVSSISYTIKESVVPFTQRRFVVDTASSPFIRLFQFNASTVPALGVSNITINGAPSNAAGVFSANAGDVIAFDSGVNPVNGEIWFGGAADSTMAFYDLAVSEIIIVDAAGTHTLNMSSSNGTGTGIVSDTGNLTADLLNFPTDDSQWVFYDDGSIESEPETEIHEFSGGALVNASISASAHKTVSLAGNAQVTVLSQSSLSKLTEFSGQSTVNVSSVSLFEKVTTFTGTASVDVTTQSDFSKRVAFSGESTVDVTASGSLFDENFELHTFAGGVTISATASGQAIKVGLVSGDSRVNATSSAQAQKVAALSGNAQVTVSTQSALSKLASLAGDAITRITTAATITKRVLLNGASTVLARASGTFFNTDSNVETYETTIEGRVKAPLVVKGTVKSLTIQGRVK